MTAYVRPSALGVAEYCPTSVALSEQSGINREAVKSTAWHAKCAGNDTLIGELPPSERAEVASYGVPTNVTVPKSSAGPYADDDSCVDLEYDRADKELHVSLFDRDTLVTEGTLDFAWVVTLPDGRAWAFVADLKRNTWGIPDGPDCLQLAAYGHAYSHLRGCVGYTPGLWSGTDSEWTWGTPVDLTSPEALDIWIRLKRAAKNDSRHLSGDKARAVTGEHCRHCYGRMRCPEWAMLAVAGSTLPEAIDSTNAAQLLLAAQAAEEVAARTKESVKIFSERGGVVKDAATGKVYLPTLGRGREGLDKEALLAEYPDAKRFWKKGKPILQFGWRRPRHFITTSSSWRKQ